MTRRVLALARRLLDAVGDGLERYTAVLAGDLFPRRRRRPTAQPQPEGD